MTINKMAISMCIVIVFCACSSNVKEEKFKDGKAHKKYEISKRDDGSFFKNGYYKSYYINGNNEIIGNYKDGKKVDLWTYYYDNGNVETTGKYKDNERVGLWISYDNDGNKSSEENYVDGKMNGVSTFWSANGSIKYLYKFENDSNVSLVGKWLLYNEEVSSEKPDTIIFNQDKTYEISSYQNAPLVFFFKPSGKYNYIDDRNNYYYNWEIGYSKIKIESLLEMEFTFTEEYLAGKYRGKRLK